MRKEVYRKKVEVLYCRPFVVSAVRRSGVSPKPLVKLVSANLTNGEIVLYEDEARKLAKALKKALKALEEAQ